MASVKDYYDILGVRPQAQLPEIELAFKGRRTQYHPDKYANADADTIRWATERMQEVNEAYAVLSHPEARTRYDEHRHHTHHRNTGPRASSTSNRPEDRQETGDGPPHIFDYLTAISLSQPDAKRFHFAPHIPLRKLNNAISCRSAFSAKPPGQVYLLVDDTVFEGGADGLLITDEWISFKEMFIDSKDYRYALGWNSIFSQDGSTVKLRDQSCLTFSLVSAAAVQMVVWELNRFLADLMQWHVRMAPQGHAESQFILSLNCCDQPDEELRWMTMAAEGGHVHAQHNLGQYYYYKNPELAFQWFTKAAEQGSANALRALQSDIFRQFH